MTPKHQVNMKKYIIISTDRLDEIDYSKILQTSRDTLRKSVDGTKCIIKFKGDCPEEFLDEAILSFNQILDIINNESNGWIYNPDTEEVIEESEIVNAVIGDLDVPEELLRTVQPETVEVVEEPPQIIEEEVVAEGVIDLTERIEKAKKEINDSIDEKIIKATQDDIHIDYDIIQETILEEVIEEPQEDVEVEEEGWFSSAVTKVKSWFKKIF